MNVILNTHYVILNVVKNLLSDNTLSTLSLVDFEEILRVARDDRGLRGDCHEPIGSRNDGVQHQPRNDAHTNNVIARRASPDVAISNN